MARGYPISVRATDSHGNNFDKDFFITVTDVSETPPDDPLPDDGTIEDDDTFTNPPIVVVVDAGVKLAGKKAAGSVGKFIYDLGAAEPETIYTIEYDPDFTLLTNTGKNAAVGLVIKQGNDFHFVGLRGDGASGIDAVQVYGANKWTAGTGFTEVDGDAAQHGSQAGPNWIQFEVSADGVTYTFRTSADGESWEDEFTDVVPAPHDDVDGPAQFGIGAIFAANDTGSFSINITAWTEEAALATDPHFASVAFLCAFDGVDAATSATDESPDARTITFAGNAQLDTAQAKFGTASLLTDGADGSFVSIADSADWQLAGEFTIEAWVRFATTPDTAGEHIIGQWGNNGACSWSLYIHDTGAAEAANFRFSTDGSSETHALGSTDLNFAINTWYHVCAERDASNKMRLYWDGVMVASKTGATGTSFNSALAVRLGQNGRTVSDKESYSGWIDEARITIGAARYASDAGFTPPAEAFPRQ